MESPLNWWFMKNNVNKLNKQYMKIWNRFLDWMVHQKIDFTNDMHKYNTWKWRISVCKQFVRHSNKNVNEIHKKQNEKRTLYRKCEQVNVEFVDGILCKCAKRTR